MTHKKICTLRAAGTPYEIGRQHGEAYRDAIRHYAAERVALVQGGEWSGHQKLNRSQVLELAEASLPAHRAYAPDLTEEMQGMADAADLSMAEMVVVGGFTDFIDTVYSAYKRQTPLEPILAVDDCTAFIVPDARAGGAGFFGQTWDMHDTAADFVLMLEVKQEQKPTALLFTTTGCVGQIGMNSAGIAVGINNLLGADGQVGVTWPFVVRKALQQESIEDALACITDAPLAGAHNYLLFDRNGRGYNVEAMSTRQSITPLDGAPIVHTNHCLVAENMQVAQERLPEAQTSSEGRLTTATELLDGDRQITVEDLKALTRQQPICARSTPPFHVASCGAAIMRPKTGDFWAVQGLPDENAYEHFVVSE